MSKGNQFGLVYDGAIVENKPGAVNIKPVSYQVNGLEVAANLYLPANFDEKQQYAGITVAHPNGGCKEQAAAAYNTELRGDISYEAFLPPNKTEDELRAMMAEMPENSLYRDGIEYYGVTHKHLNATGSYTTESFMKLIAFDTEDRMDLLTQPLLMTGRKSGYLVYDRGCFC